MGKKGIESFRVCPNKNRISLGFFFLMLMFDWIFLPTFLMDLDSFLYVKSIGLEYPLKNHLKGEKEIEVCL